MKDEIVEIDAEWLEEYREEYKKIKKELDADLEKMTGKEALIAMGGIIGDLTVDEEGLLKTVITGNRGKYYKRVEKDLDLLDLYKKFFKYSLTEIQGIKYLTLPNSGDIRRPDSMLKITDEEYELLKEGLENEK